MKLSVGMFGRLASAQSVRTPLRRNFSGMAVNSLVSIRRGGVSRYIMVVVDVERSAAPYGTLAGASIGVVHIAMVRALRRVG
ncbi:hypothetical protein ABH995_004252 [Bradyrhizobium yuanmingense]|uniref:hypothetical protein n=1 Tax=Bradyrhizobium yuanmingense TaxID=108015 RepID=UPI0035172AEB